MNSVRVHQFVLLLLLSVSLLAQDDHDGNNGIVQNRGDLGCTTAPQYFNQTIPVCNSTALDNYCLKMTDSLPYQAHEWPGCDGITLHNPNWITFVAGGDELKLEIEIDNCNDGRGVQIGVYRLPKEMNYGPDQAPLDPDQSLIGSSITGCFYAETPQTEPLKFTTGTTPGQLFGILIDGWNGDLCRVNINLIKGATAPSMQNEIQDSLNYSYDRFDFEEDTICQGAEDVEFSLSGPVPDAYTYVWTLNGERIPDSKVNGYKAMISVDEAGPSEVCIRATNHCDTTEPRCVTVPVSPLYTSQTIDTICEGDNYIWNVENGNVMEEYGPFYSYSGDTQMHAYYYEPEQHCRINSQLDLYVINENNESPIMLDTFTSFTNLPIEIMNHNITRPVENHLIQAVSTETSCDVYYQVKLKVLGGKFFIGMDCKGSDGAKFYFDGFDDPNFYTNWDDQFEYIDNNEDLSIEYNWSAEGHNGSIGSSPVLDLKRDELEDLAINGIGILNLSLKIYYKDELLTEVQAPPYEYDMEVHFSSVDQIEVRDDSILVANGIANSYQWLSCDNEYQAIDGANQQTYIPDEEGYYAVVINEKYCGDTTDCVYYELSGEHTEEGALLIVPNPTRNEFKVHYMPASLEGETYNIYTASGRKVSSGSIKANGVFDISVLSGGVYYLKLPDSILRFVKM